MNILKSLLITLLIASSTSFALTLPTKTVGGVKFKINSVNPPPTPSFLDYYSDDVSTASVARNSLKLNGYLFSFFLTTNTVISSTFSNLTDSSTVLNNISNMYYMISSGTIDQTAIYDLRHSTFPYDVVLSTLTYYITLDSATTNLLCKAQAANLYAGLNSSNTFTDITTVSAVVVRSTGTSSLITSNFNAFPVSFIMNIASNTIIGYDILTTTMTSNIAPSPNVCDRSSIFAAANEAWKAYDRNKTTWWICTVGAAYFPCWNSFTWGGSTVSVNAYSLSTITGNTDFGGLPRNWKFQGGQSSTTWVDLDTRVDEIGWSLNQTRTYYFNNDIGYKWYRIYITSSNNNNSYAYFSEIEMYHVNPNIVYSTFTFQTEFYNSYNGLNLHYNSIPICSLSQSSNSMSGSLQVAGNLKTDGSFQVKNNFLSYGTTNQLLGNVLINGTTNTVLSSTLTVVGTADIQMGTSRGVIFNTPSQGYGTSFSIYGTNDGYSYSSFNLSDNKNLTLISCKNWQINFRSIDGRLVWYYNDETTGADFSVPIMSLHASRRMQVGNILGGNGGDSFIPSASLEVRGYDALSTGSAFNVVDFNSKSLLNVRNDGRVGIQTSTTTIAGLFQVGGGSLTVLQNGNVGIGTTNPTSTLVVIGTITAQGFLQSCKIPTGTDGFITAINNIKSKNESGSGWQDLDHDSLPDGVLVQSTSTVVHYWDMSNHEIWQSSGTYGVDYTTTTISVLQKFEDIGSLLNWIVKAIQEMDTKKKNK